MMGTLASLALTVVLVFLLESSQTAAFDAELGELESSGSGDGGDGERERCKASARRSALPRIRREEAVAKIRCHLACIDKVKSIQCHAKALSILESGLAGKNCN